MIEELKRIIRFGLIGGSGIIVNMTVLALLFTVLSVPLWLASALAIQSAIITNFLGHHYYTFRSNGKKRTRFITFQLISMSTATVSWALLNGLALAFGTEPWWIVYAYNLLAIGAGFALNYLLNTNLTWAKT